jgi:hypothetical protein
MPAPATIAAALARVKDQPSLLNDLLGSTLEWPLADKIRRIDDIAYGWTEEDLRAQGLDKHLIDGQAWQFQPFRSGQPWGIFLLEFKRPELFGVKGAFTGATGVLRKVLRGPAPPAPAAAPRSTSASTRTNSGLP